MSENFDQPPESTNTQPPSTIKTKKRLGHYLVESGLISNAQLEIALRDQEFSGYQLGEILVLRGWIQQSVIDFVVQRLQNSDSISEGELRVLIQPGKSFTRAVIDKEGHQWALDDQGDTDQYDLLEEETCIHQINLEELDQVED